MTAATSFVHRRFTSEEVLRMVAQGILGEDEHLELIEGDLVMPPPQGPSHMSIVAMLTGRLVAAYAPAGYHLRVQGPVQAPLSLPEPDIAVVRGVPFDFCEHHPTGADTLLVIEIAQTSQAFDRRKASLYARMAVATYWLIDLEQRRLELRTDPTPDGEYGLTALLGEGEDVALPELSERWQVSSLLPPR